MAAHPLGRGVTAASTMELGVEIRQVAREQVHWLYAHTLMAPTTAQVPR